MKTQSVPRIEYLKVQNYRALKDVELKNIQPIAVFLGPNGSGKSTIFDVFAFLSECFNENLRKAWDRRGRFRELRTRGCEGAIVIEIKYREASNTPLITYHLAINEKNNRPYIQEEWLQWRRKKAGKPFKFLDFKEGEGQVISGENPEEKNKRINEKLESSEFLAVNTLGQFAKHPRVSALRKFITSWYLSYLTADNTRTIPEAAKLIGIEEPENHLYPKLLPKLAEECRNTSAKTQLMVTTHSPFFVDRLRPNELWILDRDEQGFTQAKTAAKMRGIKEFVEQGALLGSLWMEDYFEFGNPL